jgi:hypothetical protein
MSNTLEEIIAWATKRHELQTAVQRAGARVVDAEFMLSVSDDPSRHDTETPRNALAAAVAALKAFDEEHGEVLTVKQAAEAHSRANDALSAIRNRVSKLETGYIQIEADASDPATRFAEIVAWQRRRLEELRPLKLDAVRAELDARLALQRAKLYETISKLDQTLGAMRSHDYETRRTAAAN